MGETETRLVFKKINLVMSCPDIQSHLYQILISGQKKVNWNRCKSYFDGVLDISPGQSVIRLYKSEWGINIGSCNFSAIVTFD